MSEFTKQLSENSLDLSRSEWSNRIDSVTPTQVQNELVKKPGRFSLQRLAVLLSPAAGRFLEPMAQQARSLTNQRFGKTVQLYVPLYLSNVCCNCCLYCGYNKTHDFKRTRLSVDQALEEAKILAEQGFRNLLLLSGEDPKYVTTEFLAGLAARLREKFSTISAEIYPLSAEGYQRICKAGIDGVTLYQETYDRETYAKYHVAGPKADFEKRLDAPDRFASAGMRRIGLGFLLGLADWRAETLALGLHGAYLMKNYWQSQVSFSFPRIRPAYDVRDDFPHLVSDTEMVQMMLALRLCFADAGIVLSTRESAELRDNMINICVTQISAGSRTNPGGYSGHDENTEQFEIDDRRSPAQIAEMIRAAGKEPVWKDWDKAFTK